MKFVRPLVFVLGLAATAAFGADTPASAAPAQPAGKKTFPTARVAWINTSAFLNEEKGVKQLVRVLKELELEFSSQQSELSLLNEKLRTLVGELNKLQAGGAANADAIKAKQEEGLKLQQELQGKQQQFQAAVGEAQQQKQAPIVADLTKTMSTYAKEHDLGMIIDISKMGDALVIAQPELDVTDDFVAYYNAAHP